MGWLYLALDRKANAGEIGNDPARVLAMLAGEERIFARAVAQEPAT
ncbi:hypothetical protein [Jannaschia marina]|nr:hypothetical protein [Jannaschia marina]